MDFFRKGKKKERGGGGERIADKSALLAFSPLSLSFFLSFITHPFLSRDEREKENRRSKRDEDEEEREKKESRISPCFWKVGFILVHPKKK